MTDTIVSASAQKKEGKLKTAIRRLRSWFKNLYEKSMPGPRARKGASIGAAGSFLLLMGFISSKFMTGLSAPVDVLIGLLRGILNIALLAGAVFLVASLLLALPRYLRWAGTGALLAFLLFFDDFGLPRTLVLFLGLGIVVVEAFLGGAIATAIAREFRSKRVGKRILVLVLLMLAVAANIAFISWLVWPGTDSHLARVNEDASAGMTALEAPDPSQPGPYPVARLFYGSGTDKHRPEYGEGVDLQTEPVDGTPFVKDFKGWKAKFKRWYWGFGADSFPLNGRVWFPEGEGPFPLVLIVHGGHRMAEFSDPGYAYLAELLASRGFIVVSVDENFLNGSPVFGWPYHSETDARAWILLQHLRAWRSWNETQGNPFYKKVDMENLGLIGHSLGGEAVAIAGAFNNLSHHPDDANVRFDFGFSIKAIIAIAPVDGVRKPADKPVALENVNYFTLHGSHDADVERFLGDRQYNRVNFTDNRDWFKASLYIYRANHGQFNTVWGRTDASPPGRWLLNLKPLLMGEEQRQIAKVYFSAFLETTIHRDPRYRPLFRDHRHIQHWLPETIYVTRYQDASFRLVSDFEEDIDVTTTTVQGGVQQGKLMAVWREQDVKLRDNTSRQNHAVYLGWHTEAEKSDPSTETANYSISLPLRLAQEWELSPDSLLVFHLAEASEKPPKPDQGETDEEKPNENKAGEPEEAEEEEEDKKEPLDFTVELVARDGSIARLPLSRFRPLPPVLKSRFTKVSALEKYWFHSPSEPVLQTYELPLAAFVEVETKFKPANLEIIRFRFDRSPKGVIILDQVGFARPQSNPSPRPASNPLIPCDAKTSGITSFQFIQDPISAWSSHSNMDTYEALVEEDLQQSAAIIASFVYYTAKREELLPRVQSSK